MTKILIVDDYNGTLETLKYILESNGYIVRTLKNTHSIYREIEDFNPDLLMLDLLLEGEDGRQICKNLKTGFSYQDLRILVFSAHAKRFENCESYYADAFMEKPFELTELLGKIKSMMQSQLVTVHNQ